MCLCPSVCLVWEDKSIQVFHPLVFKFFLMLSCLSSLCLLNVNPISDISFANIFSHPVGSPFHFVGLLRESSVKCYSPICLLFLLLFPLPEETYQKNILLRLMSSSMLCFLLEILWFQVF